MLSLVLGSYGNSRSVKPELTLFSAARHVLFLSALYTDRALIVVKTESVSNHFHFALYHHHLLQGMIY
jgi:hypothetical protein